MDDPIKYIISSESLNGQFLVTEDTFSIGPFGGCGVLTYFKRYKHWRIWLKIKVETVHNILYIAFRLLTILAIWQVGKSMP